MTKRGRSKAVLFYCKLLLFLFIHKFALDLWKTLCYICSNDIETKEKRHWIPQPSTVIITVASEVLVTPERYTRSLD